MKGIRHVRGRLVPDEHGMPIIEINHDDLVRATWELTMEKFGIGQPPKPPTRWERLKVWVTQLLKPKERK